MFSGSLPMDLQNISSLANTVQYVNLSHNRLVGEFFKSDEISLFRNLKVLDLGDNQLSGQLPSLLELEPMLKSFLSLSSEKDKE
ncbi:hypothetical protein U1Q18_039406 [Sarracenia purpurea var. burkii]